MLLAICTIKRYTAVICACLCICKTMTGYTVHILIYHLVMINRLVIAGETAGVTILTGTTAVGATCCTIIIHAKGCAISTGQRTVSLMTGTTGVMLHPFQLGYIISIQRYTVTVYIRGAGMTILAIRGLGYRISMVNAMALKILTVTD